MFSTFSDLLTANLETNADRVAVVGGERDLTYADVHGQACHVMEELRHAGVVPGDRSGRVQCFSAQGEALQAWQLENHERGNPRGVGLLPNGHLLL